MQIIFVMAGGFLGALARYGLGEWLSTSSSFPVHTLVINLAGSFLLGWFFSFVSLHNYLPQGVSLLIGTGLLGSFTTFSTFSLETVQLVQSGLGLVAVFYVAASIIGGLSFVYAGYRLARTLHKVSDTA